MCDDFAALGLLGSEDEVEFDINDIVGILDEDFLYVVDVLDRMYLEDGVHMDVIELWSDGEVHCTRMLVPSVEGVEVDCDCPF